MPPPEFIVIGAGVSGLAAATTLKREGKEVLVLEAEPSPGGSARTIRRDDYLCERGSNTILLANPDARKFLEEMDLMSSAIEAAPQANNRFVVQHGHPVILPSSPPAFVTSSILSWKAKFRMALEPFIPAGKDPDENLADFVRRRMGVEPLRELVGPFISGVYAGDPERLIVRHALPKLYRLEQTHGSLIRGAIKTRGGTGPKGRLIGWPGGFSELASRLADKLGSSLLLETEVRAIQREENGFVVQTARETHRAPRLIVATDAASAARLLVSSAPPIARFREIPHAPVVVIHLGFPRADVSHPLNGFGMLISRARGIRTLGALFSSTLFPGRTPEDHVLLTAFIGGMLDPEAVTLDEGILYRTVIDDLRPLLGIRGEPSFRNLLRWPKAIPQYERDHPQTLRACEAVEKALPGLHLLGNYRGGISVGDCLANGYKLGLQLSSWFPGTPDGRGPFCRLPC
jgi:oxygen-dependent protoporphyrinogen oxidase